MQNIFFYTNAKVYDLTAGITKKVNSQIKAFEKLGYNVVYSGYIEDGVAIFNSDGSIITKKTYPIKSSRIQRIIRRKLLITFCTDYLKKKKESFKLIYARYHFFDSSYLKMLKCAKKVGEYVVIEAHSYPSYEKGLSIMTPVYLTDWLWSKGAYRYIDFVAAMNNMKEIWKRPTVKISNAVDIDAIPVHNPSVIRKSENEIHLVSVAFESKVHGLDRIIKGINNYKQMGGEWDFVVHFVGTHLESTKSLAKFSPYNESFIFYQPLSGKELDEVYNKADIGIGSIANHRVGSYFGSALKTIEYLAKGIPFIYGWREEIIGDDFLYATRVELNEEPINMNTIVKLYKETRKEKDLQQRVRSHLGNDQSWEGQMKKVIDYMNRHK
jgi:glycosyltransferase involved in cell wall biosynthesis